jgi:hypothetical protein
VVGLAGVSASTAALVLTDPSKRRQEGIDAAGGNEKQAVKSYFEEDGFQRWSRIYSDAAEVSKARRLNRSICPEAYLKAFGRVAEQDANHRCQRYSATLLTMQDSLLRSMKRDSVDMLMSLALRNAHQCCRSYSWSKAIPLAVSDIYTDCDIFFRTLSLSRLQRFSDTLLLCSLYGKARSIFSDVRKSRCSTYVTSHLLKTSKILDVKVPDARLSVHCI